MFPSNEKETIALFKLMQDYVGWHIVHEQTKFPDLIIKNGNGAQLLAEAEYLARNFKVHGHDPQGCDLILCWHNNWPNAPLPVWALEDYARNEAAVIGDLLNQSFMRYIVWSMI